MKQDDIDAPCAVQRFADVSALPVFDSAAPAAERRASERDEPSRRVGPRVAVQGTVRLRGAAQGAIDATVFNLSAGGCALALRGGLFGIGDLVTVKIEGVENWPGMVKWCADEEIGIAFDRPFYPPVFEAIVAIHEAKSDNGRG